MSNSGQPVSVGDIDLVAARHQPKSDLEELIEYVRDRFPDRDRELTGLHRQAATLKLKNDLIALGFAAIDYRRELSGWIAFARRVRTQMHDDALKQSYTDQQLQAREENRTRPDSKLVKSGADTDIAPLTEVIERLEAARDEMKTVVSWCQTQQNSLRDEEFGDMFESQAVPEQMFSAPIGAALSKLAR